MTFFRSLLILVTCVLLIGVPYSLGHALSNHHTTPVIVGIACLVLAVGLSFALTRRPRST